MKTIPRRFRFDYFRTVLIVLVGSCFTAMASADDWAAARPRIFASGGGSHGFKVLPRNASGILFLLDDDGNEQIIWNKQLVNVPDRAFVADDGKRIVTIDTYADLGREHSIVVYDENGKVLADYRLEDFLSEQEIRDRVSQSSPNRWWASEAVFKFRLAQLDLEYFDITLKWGKIISVDLNTGKLLKTAEDKPEDSPSTLKEKIHGAWKGNGPCDGQLTLNSNGTYARKGVGPGGDSDSGTWSLKWDALPPTLTFESKKADFEELEGKSIPGKLVRLDGDGMEILYVGSSKPIVFSRVEK